MNHPDSEFWDRRYREREYAYGREPNAYLQQELSLIDKGRILFIGEGEGRNSVYAAQNGWIADAVDFSAEGKKIAVRLAYDSGVSVAYEVADIFHHPVKENYYDAIGIFYFHLPSGAGQFLHDFILCSLKPGGRMIMEVFSKKQLQYSSGGPRDIDLLPDAESLHQQYADFFIVSLREEILSLREGTHHVGEAAVIRMTADKK